MEEDKTKSIGNSVEMSERLIGEDSSNGTDAMVSLGKLKRNVFMIQEKIRSRAFMNYYQ